MLVSVLQGLVQQTRHVLPCYLCGDMQNILSYKHHIAVCRPRTLALLDEYEQTHHLQQNSVDASNDNEGNKQGDQASAAIANGQLLYGNETRRAAIEAV